MEDTSRQQKPHSNKPYNNNSNTTSPTSPLGKKSLESIVGRAIKIKTASNEQVEGLVYTYDRTTNCLVIDYSSTSNTNTTTQQQAGRNLSFRIIKISHIKEIVSLGESTSSNSKKDYLPVNQVQVDRLKSRESEALKGFQSQVSKIGVGVTKEGQDIFNALSKTLPCRWSKDTIVVMDEILITPPYGVDNCKANATSSALLARVKKVCKIRHANGSMLNFQVCIHQDPLGSSSCLDYWLIRLSSTSSDTLLGSTSTINNATSVLRLSPFGTIEQIQASPILKQPPHELLGRPVMAFVYKDDVESLCANLSKICSVQQHRHHHVVDPLFIRWSSLPYLLSTSMLDHEDSLNYDWMSFTLMSGSSNNNNSMRRPICILQPLQIPTKEATACEESLVLHFSVFDQLADYCRYMIQVAGDSKAYITEFYHHVACSLMELLSIFMQQHPALQEAAHQESQAPCTTAIATAASTPSSTHHSVLWNFIKSNYILQRSLTILEFTGLLDQHHYFKTCIETVSN
ncbi:conserved hypothetical protein [Mucor ambiguus]|uniref:AD domain-containing protein n=1 Tax=Mucor ambiguus TaxID=91626 RepID=A0A0C9MIG3_9FUNG|nr:conserved hypothetical protein [Mucor ambiguus]